MPLAAFGRGRRWCCCCCGGGGCCHRCGGTATSGCACCGGIAHIGGIAATAAGAAASNCVRAIEIYWHRVEDTLAFVGDAKLGCDVAGCPCARMRLRFRLADPSLKIFTIKRKLHPLIGLDWFGEVTNVSIARWSYCCRVDEIDYDYGRGKREGEKETWK